MTWEQAISDFQNYLKLERSMSLNTIDAYKRDLFKFSSYLIQKEEIKDPLKVKPIDIQSFLGFITEADMSARSQSRNLSSIKGFYKYLIIDDYLSIDPSELIHSPKVAKKLPEFLTKVPGIAFLSGGQTEVEATENLNLINKYNDTNFIMTYSYGRALQQSALKFWSKDINNTSGTQKIFNHRANMCTLAAQGKWSKELEAK